MQLRLGCLDAVKTQQHACVVALQDVKDVQAEVAIMNLVCPSFSLTLQPPSVLILWLLIWAAWGLGQRVRLAGASGKERRQRECILEGNRGNGQGWHVRDQGTFSPKAQRGMGAIQACPALLPPSAAHLAHTAHSACSLHSAHSLHCAHSDLQVAGHQNVVTLKSTYEDRESVHLVMELCAGGELFDRCVLTVTTLLSRLYITPGDRHEGLHSQPKGLLFASARYRAFLFAGVSRETLVSTWYNVLKQCSMSYVG